MSALSQSQIKFIRSLHQKKHRQMYGKFLVEGDKTVRELMSGSFVIDSIYAVPDWIATHSDCTPAAIAISEGELRQLSTHDNPNQVIAIASIPVDTQNVHLTQELHIACDQISDPGNAGTIIRIADWFKIGTVIFSENSVEVYNPKVVSAAKGSLFRVKVISADLDILFNENKTLPVLGAAMDGQSIYHAELPKAGILLIGNEANGIRDSLNRFISKRIAIPSFGDAESLNAGVATGIIVSEWRRKGGIV